MECHCSRARWRQKAVRMKRNLAGLVRRRTQWISVLAAEPEGVSSSHKTHKVTKRINSFWSLGEPVWSGLGEDFALSRASHRQSGKVFNTKRTTHSLWRRLHTQGPSSGFYERCLTLPVILQIPQIPARTTPACTGAPATPTALYTAVVVTRAMLGRIVKLVSVPPQSTVLSLVSLGETTEII